MDWTQDRYYSANNCGLLTYLIVHRNYRGQGLDRVLVESALEILDHNAKDKGCGHLVQSCDSCLTVTLGTFQGAMLYS
jgi:GNAT superfamily N-acetyltransferase